jgi:hypothetical protein
VLAGAEPSSQSPSLDVMPARTRQLLFAAARISAQTMAIGVRDKVLPPMPTDSPSLTSAAASSRFTTFSCRLRSRALSLRRKSR